MSTPILQDAAGVYLNQFDGGPERGICHQITLADKYIQLTRKQMDWVVAAYLAHRLELPLDKLAALEEL